MGRRLLSLPVVAVLALTACQTITEELPQPNGPTGVVAGGPQIPVVVVPIVLPSPTSVTPAPAPGGGDGAPAPAPAPPAPNTPSSGQCSLSRGTGSGNSCPRESPTFLREVEAAIDQLIRDEPNLFNKGKTAGCGTCYEVRDWTRYTQRMAQVITRNGICGHYDGEELAVKDRNSFNDQFDILTSGGFIRRELGSYRSTCHPAWF